MHKTTIYLPDGLKAELERTAMETQRSEADIIREGIQLVIARHRRPAPPSDAFDVDEMHTDHESRRLAMRQQYLPENDAPVEERESWRRIARAAAERR
jgi:hypothetical protein